ncbi:MAG: choice-of-anchor K domain-containing protein, partial [Acidimicrobiales bacterium]|nr:choice-of-anchor K domain-containing protein [Acidimicrobiales bacterium]
MLASSLALITADAPPAAAVPVTVGPVQAQIADHVGQTSGTSGNCIRYRPPGTATSSAFVSSPDNALTAHGRQGPGCPSTLSTTTQSAFGFGPSEAATIEDGQQFLLGRMVHYNNPVTTQDRYFTGTLRIRLTGLAGTPTLDFPWDFEETPNQPSDVNDELRFSSQISPITVTQGGFTFRLVVFGFVPVDQSAACPATPAGTPVNEFSTVEGQQTNACLYASLEQDRSPLTIIKRTVGSPPEPRSFDFTSSSDLAGSAWENGSFSLASGESEADDLTSGETVTVTETDPGDDRWVLTDLTCTQIGADGEPEAVPGTAVDLDARQVVLADIPAPPDPDQPGVTCTFTNTYVAKATLTLEKEVRTGTAERSLWTLTASGSDDEISGPAG